MNITTHSQSTNVVQQGTIDQYFDKVSGTSANRQKFASRRLQKVVSDYRKSRKDREDSESAESSDGESEKEAEDVGESQETQGSGSRPGSRQGRKPGRGRGPMPRKRRRVEQP